MFPELMAYLSGIGETDYETVYIDGTKLEANANRYSFVWRGSVEKNLAKLREKAAGLCEDIATVEQLESQARKLREEMGRQGIVAVQGRGHHKHELQRQAEQLEELAGKWRQYEQYLATMDVGRNSYAKTDTDATFMRMKEDYMRNGQLKPSYNVQLALNSEYIVGYGVFSDRTDSGALKPVLQDMEGCTNASTRVSRQTQATRVWRTIPTWTKASSRASSSSSTTRSARRKATG